MQMIPTVGSKLWYWTADIEAASCINPTQPFDATVVYVSGLIMVNLRVTDHRGFTWTEQSVPLRDPYEGDRHGKERIATWPPYQKKEYDRRADDHAPKEVVVYEPAKADTPRVVTEEELIAERTAAQIAKSQTPPPASNLSFNPALPESRYNRP